MSDETAALTDEVTDLLQRLIRNACVNDGTVASGGEVRNADLLESYLSGCGADIETFDAAPGRRSLVARIEGSDPTAPTLLLMGHTDVVPVTPERWRRDPFGGELVDGEVWGRGAVDMLDLTSSMAVAFRRLAKRGFRPRGTLIYLAVADEEALGSYGADWLLRNEQDAVRCDYVVTESGGFPLETPAGTRLPILVAEKGSFWATLRVRGTPGHASMPYGSDNALAKAGAVISRLSAYSPTPEISLVWRRFVAEMGFAPELAAALVDPEQFGAGLAQLPYGLATEAHAVTRMTVVPTTVQGGVKTNVIPDSVDVGIDVRTLPGQTGDDVRRVLDGLLGDLVDDVEVVQSVSEDATESPLDTPLWDALARLAQVEYPGSALVPVLSAGATDGRFFRQQGVPAYGFGLYSRRLTLDDYMRMFHGDDERVDQDSLRLSTQLWLRLAEEMLA